MSDNRGLAVVTGATGFLGQILCEKLQGAGYSVRAAARTPRSGPWSEFVAISLPTAVPPELCAGADVVFHLAGRAHAMRESPADAMRHRQVNTQGTVEVAENARAAGVKRFVFMSTVKVFGEPGAHIVSELQAATATDPYGASKREAESALRSLETPEFEVVILRPALVYGPGAKGNLAALTRLLRRQRMPPLPQIRNRRSMVGVNDLIDATVLVGCHPKAGGRTYTVTDGEVYSTTQIVETLARARGIEGRPRITVPLPALHVAALLGDAARTMSRRRVPFDSEVLSRLVGNAEYEAVGLRKELDFAPRQKLADLAESMLHERS